MTAGSSGVSPSSRRAWRSSSSPPVLDVRTVVTVPGRGVLVVLLVIVSVLRFLVGPERFVNRRLEASLLHGDFGAVVEVCDLPDTGATSITAISTLQGDFSVSPPRFIHRIKTEKNIYF